MDLDSLIRHFFETDDPTTLTEAAYERGLGQLKIGFGVEREPGRKFALWTLLEALGDAPGDASDDDDGATPTATGDGSLGIGSLKGGS